MRFPVGQGRIISTVADSSGTGSRKPVTATTQTGAKTTADTKGYGNHQSGTFPYGDCERGQSCRRARDYERRPGADPAWLCSPGTTWKSRSVGRLGSRDLIGFDRANVNSPEWGPSRSTDDSFLSSIFDSRARTAGGDHSMTSASAAAPALQPERGSFDGIEGSSVVDASPGN